LGLLAGVAVLGVHLFEWALLALSASSDSAPPRTCPCSRDTTGWTAVFWTPEALLAVGLLTSSIVRKIRFWFVSVLLAFVSLVVLGVLYEQDIRRVWSLPRFLWL
jgi:hypothetical protein